MVRRRKGVAAARSAAAAAAAAAADEAREREAQCRLTELVRHFEEQFRQYNVRLKAQEGKKDHILEPKDMRAYRDTDDRLIEEGVTHAVADLLEDGVVVTNRYEFKGWSGDVDGVVAGRWENQDVIVFVETKHNMDAHWNKALRELCITLGYWEELKGKLQEERDEDEEADYAALQMGEYGKQDVMFAFNGSKFTTHACVGGVRTPSFYVVPNLQGKFKACMGVHAIVEAPA